MGLGLLVMEVVGAITTRMDTALNLVVEVVEVLVQVPIVVWMVGVLSSVRLVVEEAVLAEAQPLVVQVAYGVLMPLEVELPAQSLVLMGYHAVMAVEMVEAEVSVQVEPPHMEVMAVSQAEAEVVVGFIQPPAQRHQVALAQGAKSESIVGR